MEDFIQKIFSEYGLAMAIMAGGIFYLLKDRNAERAERKENLVMFMTAVERQTLAIGNLTDAIRNRTSHDKQG